MYLSKSNYNVRLFPNVDKYSLEKRGLAKKNEPQQNITLKSRIAFVHFFECK